MPAVQIDRLAAVRREVDLEAFAPKDRAKHLAQGCLIVHDQDRFAAPCQIVSCG
jgi:hypothetical protein